MSDGRRDSGSGVSRRWARRAPGDAHPLPSLVAPLPTLLAFVLLLSSCGNGSIGPQLGDSIDVPYGASTRIPGDTTSVRFTSVVSDSRCPSGAMCVWAGEATVQFTVGGTEQVTLRLGPAAGGTTGPGPTAIVRGTQMTFLALAPYPAINRTIAMSDYVATVKFTSAKD